MRSLDRDKIHIMSIWTIQNYHIIFLYKIWTYNTQYKVVLDVQKKKNVQNFEGNRSVRSLDRDKMRIISIWTIFNYHIRFVDKMLKSR